MSTKANKIISLAAGIAEKLNNNVISEDDREVELLIAQMNNLFERGENIKPSQVQSIEPYGIYSGD